MSDSCSHDSCAHEDEPVIYEFSTLVHKELGKIETRRKALDEKLPEKKKPENLFGLAFSGGGIRAAIFALGLLKNLANENVVHYFDYLSTVSGGGYTGTGYLTYINHIKEKSPKDKPNAEVLKEAVLTMHKEMQDKEKFPYVKGGLLTKALMSALFLFSSVGINYFHFLSMTFPLAIFYRSVFAGALFYRQHTRSSPDPQIPSDSPILGPHQVPWFWVLIICVNIWAAFCLWFSWRKRKEVIQECQETKEKHKRDEIRREFTKPMMRMNLLPKKGTAEHWSQLYHRYKRWTFFSGVFIVAEVLLVTFTIAWILYNVSQMWFSALLAGVVFLSLLPIAGLMSASSSSVLIVMFLPVAFLGTLSACWLFFMLSDFFEPSSEPRSLAVLLSDIPLINWFIDTTGTGFLNQEYSSLWLVAIWAFCYLVTLLYHLSERQLGSFLAHIYRWHLKRAFYKQDDISAAEHEKTYVKDLLTNQGKTFPLSDANKAIVDAGAPYLLCNITMQNVESSLSQEDQWGSYPFIFGACYSGSRSLYFVPNKGTLPTPTAEKLWRHLADYELDLCMSLSGAAFATSMGRQTGDHLFFYHSKYLLSYFSLNMADWIAFPFKISLTSLGFAAVVIAQLLHWVLLVLALFFYFSTSTLAKTSSSASFLGLQEFISLGDEVWRVAAGGCIIASYGIYALLFGFHAIPGYDAARSAADGATTNTDARDFFSSITGSATPAAAPSVPPSASSSADPTEKGGVRQRQVDNSDKEDAEPSDGNSTPRYPDGRRRGQDEEDAGADLQGSHGRKSYTLVWRSGCRMMEAFRLDFRGAQKNPPPFLNLTDGGHFENTGLWQLLRRKCRLMVATDAGEDHDAACTDLQFIFSSFEQKGCRFFWWPHYRRQLELMDPTKNVYFYYPETERIEMTTKAYLPPTNFSDEKVEEALMAEKKLSAESGERPERVYDWVEGLNSFLPFEQQWAHFLVLYPRKRGIGHIIVSKIKFHVKEWEDTYHTTNQFLNSEQVAVIFEQADRAWQKQKDHFDLSSFIKKIAEKDFKTA